MTRRFLAALAIAATLATMLPAAPAAAAGNAAFKLERLAGTDRYATAAAISRRFFPAGVPVVFVATGAGFADGLAAGPAAAKLGGPVLFTAATWLPGSTLTEITRLKPGRIIVVGGTGVISEGVRAQLAGLAPGGAQRVAGADRYATAAALSAAFFPAAATAYVATGLSFPDALAGGAAAAVQGAPILLVRPSVAPDATMAELQRLHPSRIVILGGTGVVSSAVASQLQSVTANVARLAGADRYQTAVAVSKATFPTGAANAFLATGLTYPDALAAIPAARRAGAPVLLVRGQSLPVEIAGELARLNPGRAFMLGGSAVVGVPVAKLTQRTLGACWSAYKPAKGATQTFSVIPDAPNQVALTFDMGGRMDPAVAILEFLVANGVCATIFPTGAASQTAAGRAALAIIHAHPELFEVGNHTIHHCNLRDGGGGAACPAGRPSSSFVAAELKGAEAIVAPLAGSSTVPYWRPPYGATDAGVAASAAAAGYSKTFMWDIDTIDWRHTDDGGPTAAQMSAKVVNGARSGTVVLMHLGGWNTLSALPSMISGLRGRGFTLTTASDMLD
ncbi:MAG TPA: cell wall-binding repeat-containing protein [Candidatus Limnocylindria bacterium]|nr:cell wall-binding repeat-containing protein [Candidatus Limnocylindria bacterium]